MNNSLKIQSKFNYLIISFIFTIVILFYGNFQFRTIFTWLPSLLVIFTSILIFITYVKVNKVLLKVIFINSIWLLYALLFSFSVLNFEIHIKAILETLLYILVFSIIIFYLSKDINKLFKTLLFSLNIFLFVSTIVLLFKITGLYDNGHSFSSLYSNRNTFAFMALVYLTIVLNLPKYIIYRYKTIAIIMLVIFILLTGSSKGVLGMVIIFGLFILKQYNFKKIIFILPVFLLLFSGSLLVFENTSDRLMQKVDALSGMDDSYKADNIGHDSGKIRIFLAINAINIFLDHKVSGVGVNNGQYYLTLPDAKKNEMDSLNSQNNITEMLLNVGLPGFLMFYIPLLYLLYKSVKKNSIDNEIKTMVITLVILKIFMDIGMKSYNDAGHVFLLILAWFLYYKILKKEGINR